LSRTWIIHSILGPGWEFQAIRGMDRRSPDDEDRNKVPYSTVNIVIFTKRDIFKRSRGMKIKNQRRFGVVEYG